MSDFSLTLVLRFKTSKIAHDMAKVSIKSERITPFGGIFHVRELFSRYVGPLSTKCWVSGVGCRLFLSGCIFMMNIQIHTDVFRKILTSTYMRICTQEYFFRILPYHLYLYFSHPLRGHKGKRSSSMRMRFPSESV